MTSMANTTLVGPIMTTDEDRYEFVVVCGSSEGVQARVDHVESEAPWLLASVRLGWITTLRIAENEIAGYRVEGFDNELALARAAAEVWPEQFASIVAEGEVREAGGSRA